MKDLTEQIAEAAEKVISAALDRDGTKLDYSEESLESIEEMLAEASDFIDRIPREHLKSVVEDFGCYILEVARRKYGGKYYWFDQRDQPVLVVGEPAFHVAIITWDKVKGRVGGDTGDNIPFFYQGFADRVQKAKPGDHVLYV